MILDEILGHKRAELAAARAHEAPEKLARRAEECSEPKASEDQQAGARR